MCNTVVLSELIFYTCKGLLLKLDNLMCNIFIRPLLYIWNLKCNNNLNDNIENKY